MTTQTITCDCGYTTDVETTSETNPHVCPECQGQLRDAGTGEAFPSEYPECTAGEVMDECSWFYDRAADSDPESGPKLPHDGYSVADYFTISPRASFASRALAVEALRASYKGADAYGVGLEIPE